MPNLRVYRLFLAAFGLASGLASLSAAAPEDTSQTAAILSGMQICADDDFSPATLPDALADWEQVLFSEHWKDEWTKAQVLVGYSVGVGYFQNSRAARRLMPTPRGLDFHDEIEQDYRNFAADLVPNWAQSIWAHPSGARMFVEFFGATDRHNCIFQVDAPSENLRRWVEATTTWTRKSPTTFGVGWHIKLNHVAVSARSVADLLVLDNQKLPGFGDQPLTLWYRGNLAPTGMPTANTLPNGAEWDALEVALTACRDRGLRVDGWAGALKGWKKQEDLEASVLHFARAQSMISVEDKVWRAPEFYARQTADAILLPEMEKNQSQALENLEKGAWQAFHHPLGWHLIVEASPDPEHAAYSICFLWGDTLPQEIVDWLAQGQLGFAPKPALFGQSIQFEFEKLDPDYFSVLRVIVKTNPQTELFSAAPAYFHVYNFAEERME